MRKLPAPSPRVLTFLLLPTLLLLTFQEATPCADALGCLDVSNGLRLGVLAPEGLAPGGVSPLAVPLPALSSGTASLPLAWQIETSSCQGDDLLYAVARLLQTPNLVAVLDLGCLPLASSPAAQWILDAGLPLFRLSEENSASRPGWVNLPGLPQFSLAADAPSDINAWFLFYPDRFPMAAWAESLCSTLAASNSGRLCQAHPLADYETLSASIAPQASNGLMFLLEDSPENDLLLEALAGAPHPPAAYVLALSPAPCQEALVQKSVNLLHQALPGALSAAGGGQTSLARESLLQRLQDQSRAASAPVCTWNAVTLRPLRPQF